MKYCNSQNIGNAYLATHSLCVSLSSNRGAWGMWLAQFFFHFIIDNIYLKPSIHVYGSIHQNACYSPRDLLCSNKKILFHYSYGNFTSFAVSLSTIFKGSNGQFLSLESSGSLFFPLRKQALKMQIWQKSVCIRGVKMLSINFAHFSNNNPYLVSVGREMGAECLKCKSFIIIWV